MGQGGCLPKACSKKRERGLTMTSEAPSTMPGITATLIVGFSTKWVLGRRTPNRILANTRHGEGTRFSRSGTGRKDVQESQLMQAIDYQEYTRPVRKFPHLPKYGYARLGEGDFDLARF